MGEIALNADATEVVRVSIAESPLIYIEDLDRPDVTIESAKERLFDVSDEVADFLRSSVGRMAVAVRPDLAAIGASKATVKFAVKLSVKNGKLTSWVTEVGAEGTVEVSVEFVPK